MNTPFVKNRKSQQCLIETNKLSKSKMKLAYLIIAHNELNILNRLIRLIDWPGNSIHILIDSKSTIKKEEIYCATRFSHVYVHAPGINIMWGGSSMIEAELFLLNTTSKEHYDYYCLLSGVDLPIKSQQYIHSDLKENEGNEYVGVNEGWLKRSGEDSRFKVYHPLQNYVGRTKNLLWFIERIVVKIQEPFVNRYRNSTYRFEGGPQWFCITDSFCRYVLRNEEWIRSTFKYTECSDEIFMQTLLVNSDYYNRVFKPGFNHYDQCRRLIEFKNGSPYIWRTSDYDRIMNSDAWFARKFSEAVDMNIVNMISEKIGKEQEEIINHNIHEF